MTPTTASYTCSSCCKYRPKFQTSYVTDRTCVKYCSTAGKGKCGSYWSWNSGCRYRPKFGTDYVLDRSCLDFCVKLDGAIKGCNGVYMYAKNSCMKRASFSTSYYLDKDCLGYKLQEALDRAFG
ncbi:hypothetical protein PCE1_004220 [Barthelona sp. PCE]